MKRYYISPIIGDGSFEQPYRPAISNMVEAQDGAAAAWEISSGPDGRPNRTFALCVVDAPDHVGIRGGQNVDSLPDITFDATLNTMNSGQRTALMNRLGNQLGIDTSSITASSTFQELLQRIGSTLNASFNPLKFDAKAR